MNVQDQAAGAVLTEEQKALACAIRYLAEQKSVARLGVREWVEQLASLYRRFLAAWDCPSPTEEPLGASQPMQEPDAEFARAAARLTARETDAQGKAKLRALEVCTSIWPVTPEDSAAVNRLLYRHERALRGLPDITDELAMEHLGLDAPKPEEKADEAERFCEALKEIRRATIPVFSYPGREGMNMDWLREVCHAALVGRPFQAPAQARVAYLRPKGRITEVSTDEDLLQRLPAMFRKPNGEPPTDADCARLVRLLRKPRSNP